MECTTKRIWGASINAYISWFFVLVPYIALILLSVFEGHYILWGLPIVIVLSYLLYFIIGIAGIGYVSIGDKIYCPRDLTPRIQYIQGKLDFAIDQVVGIEFRRMEGNSEGLLQYRMWDFSYLVFYLEDNSTKALYLLRFSPKQYKQIQNEIIKRKSDILVLCSSDEFLKKYNR